MKFAYLLSSLSLCSLIFYSCASVQPYYNNENGLASSFDEDNIDFELFMVGDIGLESNTLGPDELVNQIKGVMRPNFSNQAVVFVGNSLSSAGLPDEETPEYDMAIKSISECIDVLTEKTELVFFTLGNNEWSDGKNYSSGNLLATEHFLETIVSNKNIMRPSDGCSDPEIINLTSDLILVLVDSQWLLESDDSNNRVKSGCTIQNNLEFIDFMNDIVAANKNKNIVIASHHPLYANGRVGGNHPLSSHLLPVPVVGSLVTGVKKIMGGPQQFGHPNYESYRSSFLSGIANCEGCITVSGHDNSLQYFEKNENHFVVAGSGSKVDYVRKGDGANFSSMSQGFTKIIHTKDGELWLEMYSLNESTKDLDLLYRKLMYKKVIENYEDKTVYKPKEQYSKTKKIIASELYGKKKFLRGEFYRSAWSQEVEVPVLWLDEVHGGLKPIQQGGGFQTQSIRLENPDGVQYVLRSVNKDVEKIVPPALRNTFAQKLVQDGIGASHPYGAAVVPILAEAAGIYHANPTFVYLPHQKVLGDYNTQFAEGLYLFEERPGGNTVGHDDYGNTEKTVNTLKLLEITSKKHNHFVDQKFVIKSRLFDLIIGDWDRHDDQWRWGSFKEGPNTIYRPIPRDRDQVFFKNDGVIDFIASRPYFSPQLRKFDKDIDFLEGLIFNARHFDRSFLNQLSKEDFINAAREIQMNVTDEVIHSAFDEWPIEVKKLNGAEIIEKISARKDRLQEYAAQFYDYLYREVAIKGTNSKDVFDINFLDDNRMEIIVYHESKDAEHITYRNTIDGDITKELRLFGLKKDDQFIINGKEESSIKVIIVGGSGEDSVMNKSSHLNVEVYDRPEGISISGLHKSKVKDEEGINSHDRYDWKQNRLIHFPMLSFYTDEGIGLSYNVWWTRQGFRADPFKSNHTLAFSYFPTNSAYVLDYKGYYPKAIGNADFELDLNGVGPAFTQFYYGLGNTYVDYSSVFPDTEEASSIKFHIVKGTHIDLNTKFIFKVNSSSTFKINPSAEFFQLKDTDDDPRFYLQPEAGISSIDLGSAFYGGIGFEYNTQRLDNVAFPNRGFSYEFSGDYKQSFSNADFSNVTFETNLKTYIPFSQSKNVVLAMNMGAAYTFGDQQFFHANYLSNQSRLRGFKTNRFGGEGIVYHATDLRIQIARGKGSVPISMGVFGSFDYGKAWHDDTLDDDNGLHTSVGGGLYFAPLNLASFRLGYFVGEDDTQITIGGSLAF